MRARLYFPVRPRDEVVAGFGSRGAPADVGEDCVIRRVGKLHNVVTAAHLRDVKDQRPFSEVKPADRDKRVAVDARALPRTMPLSGFF